MQQACFPTCFYNYLSEAPDHAGTSSAKDVQSYAAAHAVMSFRLILGHVIHITWSLRLTMYRCLYCPIADDTSQKSPKEIAKLR